MQVNPPTHPHTSVHQLDHATCRVMACVRRDLVPVRHKTANTRRTTIHDEGKGWCRLFDPFPFRGDGPVKGMWTSVNAYQLSYAHGAVRRVVTQAMLDQVRSGATAYLEHGGAITFRKAQEAVQRVVDAVDGALTSLSKKSPYRQVPSCESLWSIVMGGTLTLDPLNASTPPL